MDFGTGSGCIAITILLEFGNSFAYMIEKSEKALKFAKKNLERYELKERAKINFENECDLIISNPPYIPSDEISKLDRTVKDFEPHLALDGGIDGMYFYKLILKSATRILKSDGYIIFETGNLEQVNFFRNLNDDFVFEDEIFDYGNFPRCVILKRRN